MNFSSPIGSCFDVFFIDTTAKKDYNNHGDVMAKNVKISKAPKKQYFVKNALINYYLVLMFTVFPLFYTEQYSNIRHDKLNFFLYLSLGFILIESIILLCNIFSNNPNKIQSDKKWYQKLSVTDYAFASFILSALISTCLSEYPLDAISGTQGRNNGLLLLCVYFGIYIIISRWFIYKEYILPLFAVTSNIVFILCILNFHYIDPLGIFKGYNQQIQLDFTSTIGNRNLMACFCCLTVPIFLMLFIHLKSSIRYLYLISAGIGFSALICTNSECGFLGLLPTLAIILIYCTKDYKKLSDYFSGVAVMLACGGLLIIFNILSLKNKHFGTIQSFFVSSPVIILIINIFIILSIVTHSLSKKNAEPSKWLFISSLYVFIGGLVVILGCIIYFTFIDTQAKLGAVTSYFRFSEKWGTHRGFFWIKSFEIFNNSNILDKLFGTGPDTFFSAFAPYFPELNAKFSNSSTNSAHNEFINYLITIGFAGVVSYLTLTVSSIIRAFKNAKKNYLAVVFASAIICYLFQGTVNISQPITTPHLFIFIALTEACCRNCKE